MSEPAKEEQPCDDPDFDDAGDGLHNYHECPGCPAIRRWCQNCSRDHHSGGWQSCEAPHRQKPQGDSNE